MRTFSGLSELMQKIERACAVREDKIFLLDDSLSRLESFRNIETTNGFTPEECVDVGKKELANGRAGRAITSFNTAEAVMTPDDPLWGCLHYYRSLAYRKINRKIDAEREYKKAAALGFNKIMIPVYRLRVMEGKRAKPGHFAELITISTRGDQSIHAGKAKRSACLFFRKFAEILLKHFQSQDPEISQASHEECKVEVLSDLEAYLLKLKNDFSKKRLREIKRIVSEEFDEPVKPTRSQSPYISADDKAESERRRIHENYTLAAIIKLYRKHTDMQVDRQIQFNMALALDAVNFWPERKSGRGSKIEKYVRRIKNRWRAAQSINESLDRALRELDPCFLLKPQGM